MAASKFTDEVRLAIPELIADGASLQEACQQLGLRHQTVKDWLTRGRREDDGPYAEFVRAVEAARGTSQDAKTAPMTPEELRGIVAKAARAGNVRAMELMARLLKEGDRQEDEPADGFEALDGETAQVVQLPERRAS